MKFFSLPLKICLYGFAALIGGLPDQMRFALGKALGQFLVFGLGYRKHVIEQNLSRAFPQSVPDGLLKRCASHFGNLILEIFLLFGRGSMRRVGMRAEFLGVQHWKDAKAKGRGVILLSNHIGNWEVMAATGALQENIDIMLVTKRIKPAWLHDCLESERAKLGVRATYEPRTWRDILSHIKQNGTVGVVLDQFAGPPVGIRVPFFGVPVGTHSILATLAKRTQSPVLPVYNYRREDGTFVVEIFPQIAWIKDENPAKELALNTAKYTSVIEEQIRKHPEQWLWTHKRFKGDLSPLGPDEWDSPKKRS